LTLLFLLPVGHSFCSSAVGFLCSASLLSPAMPCHFLIITFWAAILPFLEFLPCGLEGVLTYAPFYNTHLCSCSSTSGVLCAALRRSPSAFFHCHSAKTTGSASLHHACYHSHIRQMFIQVVSVPLVSFFCLCLTASPVWVASSGIIIPPVYVPGFMRCSMLCGFRVSYCDTADSPHLLLLLLPLRTDGLHFLSPTIHSVRFIFVPSASFRLTRIPTATKPVLEFPGTGSANA